MCLLKKWDSSICNGKVELILLLRIERERHTNEKVRLARDLSIKHCLQQRSTSVSSIGIEVWNQFVLCHNGIVCQEPFQLLHLVHLLMSDTRSRHEKMSGTRRKYQVRRRAWFSENLLSYLRSVAK